MSELMTNLIAVFEGVFELRHIATSAIFREIPIVWTIVTVLGVVYFIKNSKLFSNRHRP